MGNKLMKYIAVVIVNLRISTKLVIIVFLWRFIYGSSIPMFRVGKT